MTTTPTGSSADSVDGDTATVVVAAAIAGTGMKTTAAITTTIAARAPARVAGGGTTMASPMAGAINITSSSPMFAPSAMMAKPSKTFWPRVEAAPPSNPDGSASGERQA
ncbi:hypothetical protein GCM10023321_73350 [Pseudonocardia eucalypti]|uniref:Uncharacterized protein n=1 Tax=Pseudonocardia eucalypti TaxID=648755 RepID=A0ABP9R974_9PSEU